ncbi:hypothetical protein [Streptomyces achromogenes]|uniref:hypothetical protein n=1 Tax=Streptomyces achromogenes TaxID=67255 RepID=UPI0036F8AA9E
MAVPGGEARAPRSRWDRAKEPPPASLKRHLPAAWASDAGSGERPERFGTRLVHALEGCRKLFVNARKDWGIVMAWVSG